MFVDDMTQAMAFYESVFEARVIGRDEVSCLLDFGTTAVNLLQRAEAPELIEPAPVAPAKSGSHVLLTIKVPDVDAVCAILQDRGVKLLNGPVDRPWGRRTAAFADPSGHAWEVAQELR